MTTSDFKTYHGLNWRGGSILVFVTGWLFALTRKHFLTEPAGDCPVDSILLFVVDILLAPNTDK